MEEGVNQQDIAQPEQKELASQGFSDKELNFRRLEEQRNAERDARVRAEMQAEMLLKEMDEIKQMLQPKEVDPLDEVEDYVDPARLRAKLEKERAIFKKEAKEIAERTYEERRQKDLKESFMQRLKGQYTDYDSVMTEANIAELKKTDPVFLKVVLREPDEYERRQSTYEKIKSMKASVPSVEPTQSIKERVEENMRNPYMIPTGSGTPSGVDLDLSSKQARVQAYEKLKAAQRRPIGNNSAPTQR